VLCQVASLTAELASHTSRLDDALRRAAELQTSSDSLRDHVREVELDRERVRSRAEVLSSESERLHTSHEALQQRLGEREKELSSVLQSFTASRSADSTTITQLTANQRALEQRVEELRCGGCFLFLTTIIL
jgi:chromosome segregation ATPase